MKSFAFTVCYVLLLGAATAQEYRPPVFSGTHPLHRYASSQFRVPPGLSDTLDKTCEPVRIVFSFVVNPEGRPDSLIFHEGGPASMENEVRRVMSRPDNRWQPATLKGRPVYSAPLYWGVLVYTAKCPEKQSSGWATAQKQFLRDYPYKKLENWREGSMTLDHLTMVSYGTICVLTRHTPGTAMAPPRPSGLQKPALLIPYR